MQTAVLLLLFFGIILGLLFGPLELKWDNSNAGVSSQIAASQLSFSLISMAACMKLFGDDELMRTREESGGISSFTLFTGKMLGSLLDFVIYPLGFAVGNYSFVKSHTSFGQFLGVYICLYMALSGLANLMAIIFPVS